MMVMMADGAVLTGQAGGAASTAPAGAPASSEQSKIDTLYGSPGAASPADGAEGGDAAPVVPAPDADAKPEEGKEEAAAEAFDPAKLTMPEGVEVDSKALELVTPVLKDLGLGQENAQKLIDAYIKVRQQELEAQMQTHQEWAQQIVADKEFGGDRFEANRDKANRLIERFGDEQLFEYLASSGAGNNPAVFRFVSRLAGAMSEDSPVVPSVAAGQQKDDVLATLYPEKKG